MNIVKFPHPALLQKSKSIVEFDSSIEKLAQDMLHTMRAAQGIGLAANQVGVNLRIFVMQTAPRQNDSDNSNNSGKSDNAAQSESDINNSVFINPLIIERSEELQEYTEGCLSFPTLYIPVSRPRDIVLQWQDIKGQVHRALFSGLAAICVQHEIDHLDGVNYVDKIGKVKRAFALKKFYKQDKEAQKRSKVEQI